jgi:hypothetical protein
MVPLPNLQASGEQGLYYMLLLIIWLQGIGRDVSLSARSIGCICCKTPIALGSDLDLDFNPELVMANTLISYYIRLKWYLRRHRSIISLTSRYIHVL